MVAPGPDGVDPQPAWGGVGASPDADLPLRHRPWSTLLFAVNALPLVLGVLAFVGGVILVAVGLVPRHTEGPHEPYGLVIGAFLIVAGLIGAAVSGVLVALSVKGQRAADSGRPGLLTGAAVTSVALAAAGVLSTVPAGLPGSLFGLVLFGAYAAPGVGLLVTMHSRRVPEPLPN